MADSLRSAHLRDNLAWTDMAVLVRAGRTMIPGLTRALVAAGVPVEVAGDEIPLAADPAVRPLLLALQVAARGCAPTTDEALLLLTSPLGGMDSMATRRLGRALREAERAELGGAALPRPSTELTSLALRHEDILDDCPPSADVDAARAVAQLLRSCEHAIRTGSTAEEALWLLWSRTAWPEKLRQLAGRGGEAGRRANRDLDAICALFDIAARSEEVSGLRGVTGFLAEVEAQQIPADPFRESELRGSAVRVLTAHRAKGLEWDLVVVAGVQEGRWPDVRRRGSLLEPDRLGRHEVMAPVPTATRIAEERRLFYVACTRARSRLVVTAVAGTEGEADQPSRFLAELGVQPRELPGRPRRPLTLAALVGNCAAPRWILRLRHGSARRPPYGSRGWPTPGTARGTRWFRSQTRTLVGLAAVDSSRRAFGCFGAAGASFWQSAGERIGLPEELVSGAQGTGRIGAYGRRQLWLGGARASGVRRAHSSQPRRARSASRVGVEPTGLRRALVVRCGAGGGGVRAGALCDLADRQIRSHPARHRGRVLLRD